MMKNKHTDAIVVGSGAGGGVVAKELAVNGFQTVLFERGGWLEYDNYCNDELLKTRGIIPIDRKKNPRVLIKKTGKGEVEMDTSMGHTGYNVGSGTVNYGAMAWRFMPEDFKMLSTYGEVKTTTLEDWPISYDDLEPYYEKAEYEVGVAGDNTNNPYAGPREKDFPMPPFEITEYGQLLSEAGKRLGLHPFPIPMARNSVLYNDRAACIRNRDCAGFICPVDAKNGTHNTVIPVGVKSGNLHLRIRTHVTQIMMGDNGKAIGVKYNDENNREHIQTADIVVISASATETPRLLLTTSTSKFPNGLGNNYDLVGRNLQSHAYCGARAIFHEDIHSWTGPGATFGICDYNHHNEGIIGGGLIHNEFFRGPLSFTRLRPKNASSWGLEHKEFQRDNFRRYADLRCCVQEMPNYHSRVFIHKKKKDYWGMPIVGLAGERHPLDVKHCNYMIDRCEEVFKEAGAKQIWREPGGTGNPAMVHQAGTCRMGDDPTKSVTNRFGQVHGIDNLFIGDASTFVTCAGLNPALTIMTLGYWVADHIVEKYKK
jgi:choline dehydrogenase-like flavoprotein